MRPALIAALLLATLSSASLAAQNRRVEIKYGFLKGNDYRTHGDSERAEYVMGVLDGLLAAPVFGAPKKNLAWLEACTVGMTNDQVTAIVDKYLRENPEQWNEGMNVLVYSAMLGACQSYRQGRQ